MHPLVIIGLIGTGIGLLLTNSKKSPTVTETAPDKPKQEPEPAQILPEPEPPVISDTIETTVTDVDTSESETTDS